MQPRIAKINFSDDLFRVTCTYYVNAGMSLKFQGIVVRLATLDTTSSIHYRSVHNSDKVGWLPSAAKYARETILYWLVAQPLCNSNKHSQPLTCYDCLPVSLVTRTRQSLGVLLTVAGFVLIFLVGSYSEPNFAHAIVGIVLTAILIHQFLNGIL